MKKIELPVIDYHEKEFRDWLKKNNVKSKIVGEGGGFLIVELKGTLKDLKKVIDDDEYGWDGDYEEEWIEDCSEEMTHKEFYNWVKQYLSTRLESEKIDITPIVEKLGEVNDYGR